MQSPSPADSSFTSATPQIDSINTSIISNLFNNDQEYRSFSFFSENTVHDISDAFDMEFWRCLVLRASHHELAIRHAACALGAMHRHFALCGASDSKSSREEGHGEFALQQYFKAIRHLLDPIKRNQRQSADVALVTCIIFICFEVCWKVYYDFDILQLLYANSSYRHFEAIMVPQCLTLTEA